MGERPLMIWGLPVVEDPTMPHEEIRLVVGSGVVRQDGTLEWNGEIWVIKNLGEPYDV